MERMVRINIGKKDALPFITRGFSAVIKCFLGIVVLSFQTNAFAAKDLSKTDEILTLEMAIKKRHSESKRLTVLRDHLQSALVSEIPQIVVNSHQKKRLPGILSLSYDGLDAERVVFHLDLAGVYCSTGAACAANKAQRSTVLTATGMSDSLVDGSLRFSLGRQTTKQQIDRAIPLIIEAIRTEAQL